MRTEHVYERRTQEKNFQESIGGDMISGFLCGRVLKEVSNEHRIRVSEAYDNVLKCLGEAISTWDFRGVHNELQEISTGVKFEFIRELANQGSKDYEFLKCWWNQQFIDSFLLMDDKIGWFEAERRLTPWFDKQLVLHFGLYRQFYPRISLSGQHAYYCAITPWLSRTKDEQLKEAVLAGFSAELEKRERIDGCCFFEPFARRYEIAIRKSLAAIGRCELNLEPLFDHDKQVLKEMGGMLPIAYEGYVRANDMEWLATFYPNTCDADEILAGQLKSFSLELPCGRLFQRVSPNYELFNELWQTPSFRRRTRIGTRGLYPKWCAGLSYLPFGRIGSWPPAGGVYMVALMHAVTTWLEEFSSPFKGRRKKAP